MSETYASRHVTPQHCLNLRHKGMYVTDTFASERDAIEPTAFWCACTQKSFGPDGQPVRPADCTAERHCCEH